MREDGGLARFAGKSNAVEASPDGPTSPALTPENLEVMSESIQQEEQLKKLKNEKIKAALERQEEESDKIVGYITMGIVLIVSIVVIVAMVQS